MWLSSLLAAPQRWEPGCSSPMEERTILLGVALRQPRLSPNISSRLVKTHLAAGPVPSAVPCRVAGRDLLHGQLGHRRLRLPRRKCFQLLSANVDA